MAVKHLIQSRYQNDCSWSVLLFSKLNVSLLYTLIQNRFLWVMRIHILRGDLTDTSAEKEQLAGTKWHAPTEFSRSVLSTWYQLQVRATSPVDFLFMLFAYEKNTNAIQIEPPLLRSRSRLLIYRQACSWLLTAAPHRRSRCSKPCGNSQGGALNHCCHRAVQRARREPRLATTMYYL